MSRIIKTGVLPFWWMALIEVCLFALTIMALIKGMIVEGLLIWVLIELRSGFYFLNRKGK